jgi:hypothetical protein
LLVLNRDIEEGTGITLPLHLRNSGTTVIALGRAKEEARHNATSMWHSGLRGVALIQRKEE